MNLLLALLFIPITILEFLYLFIIENKGLPEWMARVSRNNSSILTYGVISITLLSITKFLTTNQRDKLELDVSQRKQHKGQNNTSSNL